MSADLNKAMIGVHSLADSLDADNKVSYCIIVSATCEHGVEVASRTGIRTYGEAIATMELMTNITSDALAAVQTDRPPIPWPWLLAGIGLLLLSLVAWVLL